MRTNNKPTIVQVIDNQNLSIEQAANRLVNEQSVLAVTFPDLTEEELCNSYPEPVVLSPGDFYGFRLKKILRCLQGYERFAVYP